MRNGQKTKGGVVVQEERPPRTSAWRFKPYFDRIVRDFSPGALRRRPPLATRVAWPEEMEMAAVYAAPAYPKELTSAMALWSQCGHSSGPSVTHYSNSSRGSRSTRKHPQ